MIILNNEIVQNCFHGGAAWCGAADPGASPDNGHCRAAVWCRFHDFTDRAAITETH